LSVEPYGIMIRKDDPKFKQVVDSAIGALLTSGAINGIYNTWFEKPIAPKGINLNIPISPSLKKVMAKPTDSPDPKAYE
jgi:glutamate/aspartate transport system substrate-binding protein